MGLDLDLPEMTDENGDPFLLPLSLRRLRAASQRIDVINARSDCIQKGSDDEEFQLRMKIMKHIANDNAYAVKNLLINKIRVPGSYRIPYDINPGFFVLPCIPPNNAKDWTPGKEYEVVLICKTERIVRQMIGGRGFNAREEGRVVSEAQQGDLNCVRDLLTATIKALAESATREGCVSPLDLIDSEDNGRGVEQVLEELATRTVRVPERHVTGFNVLKVKLQNSLDYKVPDPMLLAMKAATNWYYMMTGLKLLPACKPPEDPLKEEIRIANEEICEELREQDLCPETWEDLAKGLGQPFTPDNRPAHVSLSRTGEQETAEMSDLDSTNRELSPCELLALYDEIEAWAL
ncbi:hypothetical protein SEMRO_3675_G350190.1 [Seminavis robusta]|uniref:Uncharacterized protein n=1 Tax=Seminavis robusta TaxID=568900 RepID=A0A9N8F2P1_9STRA|nr:hypothetical protein SEMRO_3675_G350190.1 [Seminavis robusta]|eukprot:Sro3675_g350190.1 n/a (349) ;mRNA; r:2621-3667